MTGPNGTNAPADLLPRAELERILTEIMAKAGVPGVSFAVLEQGRVAWVRSLGVRSTESNEAADTDTVFAGASFSKPVCAYLVMLLTQVGTLELDRPLEECLGQPLGELPRYADLAGDERTGLITTRHVLSHSAGFPNSRLPTDDGELRFLFDPGARFNFSGIAQISQSRDVTLPGADRIDRTSRSGSYCRLQSREGCVVLPPVVSGPSGRSLRLCPSGSTEV